MTIWKFHLSIVDVQTKRMPEGAKILTVQSQGEDLVMWAEVDERAKSEYRTFEVIGTGNPIEPGNRKYIGTAQLGSFVAHVYELIEEVL